jgi:hypothetical protein
MCMKHLWKYIRYGKDWIPQENHFLVPIFLPQDSHGLIWDRTGTSAVTGGRLTAWEVTALFYLMLPPISERALLLGSLPSIGRLSFCSEKHIDQGGYGALVERRWQVEGVTYRLSSYRAVNTHRLDFTNNNSYTNFFCNFFRNIFHSKKNWEREREREMIINVYWSLRKVVVILVIF